MGALERQYGHADRLDAAPMRAGDKLSIAVDQLLIGYGRRGRAVRPAPARIADIIDALEDHDMRNARQGQDVAIEAFHRSETRRVGKGGGRTVYSRRSQYP